MTKEDLSGKTVLDFSKDEKILKELGYSVDDLSTPLTKARAIEKYAFHINDGELRPRKNSKKTFY